MALLLLIAVGAGLFAQMTAGQKAREWLESTIVGRVPGYTIVKGLVGGPGLEGGAQVTVASAMKAIQRLGVGSADRLRGRLSGPGPRS